MPKTNKHIEVKPSKFKTSLCRFYLIDEECPYGSRCVFAHGEHELQEEGRNMELLKLTGLQRLDGVFGNALLDSSKAPSTPALSSAEESVRSFPRRRAVMVSLPKYNTASESQLSPYSDLDDNSYHQFSHTAVMSPLQYQPAGFGRIAAQNCTVDFQSTCRREQPLVYRHNPYSMSTYL